MNGKYNVYRKEDKKTLKSVDYSPAALEAIVNGPDGHSVAQEKGVSSNMVEEKALAALDKVQKESQQESPRSDKYLFRVSRPTSQCL